MATPLNLPLTFSFAPRISLPWFLLGLAGYAVYRFYYGGKKGVVTPERQAVFDTGMRLTDPGSLSFLADQFEKQGLTDMAKKLRARAKLPSLPPDIQNARALIVKKALNSSNPDGVDAVADAFDQQGATDTATILRQYAAGLRNNSQVSPVVVPPQESPTQQSQPATPVAENTTEPPNPQPSSAA